MLVYMSARVFVCIWINIPLAGMVHFIYLMICFYTDAWFVYEMRNDSRSSASAVMLRSRRSNCLT